MANEEKLRYLPITNKVRYVLVSGLDAVPQDSLNKSRKLRRIFAKACDVLEFDEKAEKTRDELFRRITFGNQRFSSAKDPDEVEQYKAELDGLREELVTWEDETSMLVVSEASIEAIQTFLDPKSGAQPLGATGLRTARKFLIDLETAREGEDGCPFFEDPREKS